MSRMSEESEHVVPFAGSPDDPAAPRAPRAAGTVRGPAGQPLMAFVFPSLRRTVVPLSHPVTIDGVLWEEVPVERLTGAQLLALTMDETSEVSLSIRARSAMTGLPLNGIGRLDADDAQAVLAAIRPFLPAAIRSLEDEADEQEAAARAVAPA